MEAIAAKKRSVIVAGRRTSISLEDEFWMALNMMVIARSISISTFVTEVMKRGSSANLSSSVRIAVLAHYQEMSEGIASPAARACRSASVIPFGRAGRPHMEMQAALSSSSETESV